MNVFWSGSDTCMQSSVFWLAAKKTQSIRKKEKEKEREKTSCISKAARAEISLDY